ncbi:hypothetical protein B0A52_07865 [Exophiala mesophila]|uniref:CsbD-like domain-containing protein n=1 Tax=Exophiala mesophila TaxID=212818 RepID=A0A438MVF8_EXOME|nr:hypothetical protein B0A52_07865 [Exophiala mesophila]
MVKVAENRVIDLDVFPDDPKGDRLAEQTRTAIAGKVPQSESEGVPSNAQNAVTALGGTLGGGIKGVVDTLGNTVGAVGEGLTGTVQGVGDGLGSTIQYVGGTVGAGALMSGKQGEHDEAVDVQKQNLQKAAGKSEEIESDLPATVQKHSKDANAAAKETAKHTTHQVGGLEHQPEDKVAGLSSSSS